MIRRQAGLSVRRFRELAGIPESTWYRWRQRALGGRPAKGPWPRPVSDRVAAVVHAYALRYPAWGHRKIWALTVADGHRVSMRTVHRILEERGLLNGRRYQAERRELARARKQTFHAPPSRRNRVWQTDFSEFETRAGGTWQLSGVVDYAAKFCLTCPVTATKTWREAVAALEAARERAGELLRRPLIQDLVDRDTGELTPIRVVTDNGPCYKAAAFARYIRSRPEFEHVRTRHRSPETNGVIERWYESASTSTSTCTRSTTAPRWPSTCSSSCASTTTNARTRRSTGSARAIATPRRRHDLATSATHHQPARSLPNS